MRKIVILIVLLSLVLLVGLFYWFQWRPISIRQECYKSTFTRNVDWISKNKKGDGKWDTDKKWMANPNKSWSWHKEDWGWWYPVRIDYRSIEIDYAECLLRNGMKAEIPITPLLGR